MSKFFLTTAIDYSNGDPHLGHALEKVGADAIARYRRLRGDAVHFLMGMDEHSQSVLQAAQANRVTPAEWVDQMAARFATFWQRLECSNDDWIRTTEPRHARSVTRLLELIRENNPEDIYLGVYEGLYCTGCEEFKQDNQIVDGHCIEHPSLDLVPTKEENFFFRLSRYGPMILELIGRGAFVIEPAIRRNEMLRLLESGLQDISISRARFPWGIPFPEHPEHTIYVWFDALINYLSATGFPEPGYDRLWPADLHVIGKGIARFHCVIWPAMLLSAGLAPARKVWAHGYVQWEGAKMSKTAGTAVNLDDAIKRHGADALRYFLLREVGFENDGDFTWDRFDARYTSDLADGLGNLVSRSLSMIVRYRNGTVPDSGGGPPTELEAEGRSAISGFGAALDAIDLKTGAEIMGSLVDKANLFIVQQAPWTLAKEGRDTELDRVLNSLANCLFRLAVLAWPYMPEKAAAIWRGLGQTDQPDSNGWTRLVHLDLGGAKVTLTEILFPKPAPPKP